MWEQVVSGLLALREKTSGQDPDEGVSLHLLVSPSLRNSQSAGLYTVPREPCLKLLSL